MHTLTTSDLNMAREAITDFSNSLESGERRNTVLSDEANPFRSIITVADIPEIGQFKTAYASLQSEKENASPALLKARAENLLLLLQLIEIKIKTAKLPETDISASGVIATCPEVTETTVARTALLEKEKEFRTLVMQSPVAMTIFRGRDLVIDIANHSMMENLWRKEEHEVMGKPLLEVFPELNGQGYIEKLHKVMDTGTAFRDKESMAFVDSHDGRKTFYLDYEYAPLFDINGTVSGIMCTVNDVTDKVKARKIQEIARNRYTQLIETLPVAMYTIDSNGNIDLYNQAAVTLWDRRPELGTERWCGAFKLFSLDGQPIAKEDCPMARAFRGKHALEEELFMERENGERRHVIVYPRSIVDEEGNIIAASKVMIDITDRKKAEEALAQSEEKFRVLTDTVPQFIWTGKPDGELDYFSDSVYKYSGMSPAELAHKGWLTIVHPDDRAANIEKWTHAIKTGEDFFLEHRFRHYDGTYRWQLSRAVPLLDDAGNILQWVGTSTDIDDQKNFQKNLEKLVEERTVDLQKANIELENMNRELSSFAYISSHDLQEPLRKIQTFVSIILSTDHDKLSETGKKNFARMQLAANRMKALINDLLTYSRANAAEKIFETTDLNTIISEISGEFAEAFETKGGVLKVCEIPLINAIPFQLRQLFMNLISNAIKFSTDDVMPVITIDSEIVKGKTIANSNLFKEDDYLHIIVKDNGIGFSQEYAEKIFEVFQRLHSKGEYEGTGIGLAICNKIVENHNGLIYAESEPGKGATFHIYLPFTTN